MAILRSFPKLSAAGPSGLRIQHLIDAAEITLQTLILYLLRKVINILASGKAPVDVLIFLAGGNLTARGGDVVFRHNRLRDILAETCRRAHFSVQVEAGCNLTPDHSHSRPADVLISNWVLGKTAACDISVTSPLNSNICLKRK